MKKVLGWCSHGSFALSGLCLILAILAKVGAGEIAGLSSRTLYAVALILGVYSIAFSMCGARSQASGG
jgi:hypothetical protein